MLDNEKWWLIPCGAIVLFMLFSQGGITTLSHPYLLAMFLFIVVIVVSGFLKMFMYSSKNETTKLSKKSNTYSNDISSTRKVTRNDCAKLLSSKGYELYRGLQMIYNVSPIGGYHQDCVFSNRDLNKIYEFALQVEDISKAQN